MKLKYLLPLLILASSPCFAQVVGGGIFNPGSSGGGGGGGTPGNPSGSLQINDSGSFAGIGGTPFYVTDPTYGAKCNGKTITTATTTASSGVISSSSFVTADVGKQIAVYAGTPVSTTGNTHSSTLVDGLGTTTGVFIGQIVIGSGIPDGTYVSAVNSATSVTLTRKSSTTLSGTSIKFVPFINDTIASVVNGVSATLTTNTAGISISGTAIVNYGTDDAAAINSAVTAANLIGGGTLILPIAQCVIASPIVVKNRVSIVGYGQNKSAIKWLSTNSMGTGYEGAITGNLSGSISNTISDNLFSDFEVDMSNAFTNSYQYYEKCVDALYMVRPTFRNLYMHDSIATCLGVDYVQQLTVTNNTIVNAGRGQTLTNQDGDCMAFEIGANYTVNLESSIISGNHCINPHHYGIEVENFTGQTNIITIITGNEINTNQNNTIGIEDNGGTGSVIMGNTLISSAPVPIGFGLSNRGGPTNAYNGTYGIMADNTIQGFKDGISFLPAGTGGPYSNYTIKDNTIWNSTRYGIALFGAGTTAIQTMNIEGNYVSSSQQFGIGLITGGGTPTFNNLTISGNKLQSNGQGASGGLRAGISLGLPVAGLKVTDNYAWDDGSGYQKYGLDIEAGVAVTNGFDANNHFNNNTTSPELISGTFAGQRSNIYGIASTYPLTVSAIPGYLYGLILSNDVGTPNTIIDATAGAATSSDGTTNMVAGAFTKTTAAWVAGTGNGCLDTGGVANSTWYYYYVIENLTTGTVDSLCSTSGTSPVMPSGYTVSRLVGAFLTNSSAQIVPYTCYARGCEWSTAVLDVNDATLTTASKSETLGSVPPAVQVRPLCRYTVGNTGNAALLYSLTTTANTPTTTTPFSAAPGFDQLDITLTGGDENSACPPLVTNTSGQIGARATAASTTLAIVTKGWDW